MGPRPTALAVIPENIPAELKSNMRWVGWDFEYVNGKWTKVPLKPGSIRKASSTDPATWSDWDTAISSMHSRDWPGLGPVITDDAPYTALDLDHCRDPETDTLDPWAKKIVDMFGSYTEITPSNEGVRVWIKGKPPGTRQTKNIPDERPDAKVEIFGRSGRYVTMTGHRLDGIKAIHERQDELDALYSDLFGSDDEPASRVEYFGVTSPAMSDEQIIDLCRRAANGDKFRRLYDGDTGDHNHDASSADLALCNIFAFYTQDRAQIDSLFRDSGLYRDKWERASYREPTIDKALAALGET